MEIKVPPTPEGKPRAPWANTPRRIAILWIGVIVGIIAVWQGMYIVDTLVFNPWARSFTGQPTLTGSWAGEMVLPDGERRMLHVVLDRVIRTKCRGCDVISGTAMFCEGGRARKTYSISGNPDNWAGTAFHVTLRMDDDPSPGELRLGRMDGQWSGDEIRFSVSFWRHSDTATATAVRGVERQAEPHITFTMRRTSSTGC